MEFEQSANINTLLDLHIDLTMGAFSFYFDYSGLVISDELVVKLSDWFGALLNKFISNPDSLLKKDEFISMEEKQMLLNQLNDNQVTGIPDRTIHELFEEEVRKVSGNIAVIHRDRQLTYGQLNKKSNQLAWLLRKKGISVGSIVGIMVERSLEMIIGIIAILKAGAAYLAVDT